MASSEDEEQEIISESISEYEFLNSKNDLVSFAVLPLWDREKTECRNSKPIFLSGKIDNGLRQVYTQVVAWKFDLLCDKRKPEVSVFSVGGKWLKLLKPRSRFQEIARTIQISVNFLHFCKWNAQGSEKTLWDHIDNIFSMFEKSPSEDDLQPHLNLIKEAVERDGTLANSKVLTTFIGEKRSIRKVIDENIRPPFIVNDADEDEYEIRSTDMAEPRVSEFDESEVEDEGSDEEDIYDSVCSICDNGGDILMCDGKCLRSFHPTKKDGKDSYCETLGFTSEECGALDTWLCRNCEYKRHQCYACGDLGSSDDSTGAEVFCCVNGACGYFYHPFCVAKLLHPGKSSEAKELAIRIASGENFACPAHRCHVCKELEVRKDHELQFAVCRRCPRVYHRKCLPREIFFERDLMEDTDIVRAWEGLIPNRILIYCLEHEIDPEVSTPSRNHLKFPGPQRKDGKTYKNLINEIYVASENGVRKRGLPRKHEIENAQFYSNKGDLSEKRVENRGDLGSARIKNAVENTYIQKKDSGSDEGKRSLGDKLFNRYFSDYLQEGASGKVKNSRAENEMMNKVKHTTKSSDDVDALDNYAKIRLLTAMKDASSSITLEIVKGQHKSPSTHSHYFHNVDAITVGKLEGVKQALHAALTKLEYGGSIKDARAICSDDILVQVQKWRDKLRVYLAPFLYGPRYTSFGRHFTKIDKLKKVVDILHWYAEEGDMVVDFCCGSNDFNCLMKTKLDSMGKKVLFKNYDIVQPKNDFNFERRDWMHVRKDELPRGSQLIMGLNPPFGVNGALANKFINKALTFKPKLIILIVPRETERLDKKEYPYDLIWEDSRMFEGKSFYLPGCVDGNKKPVEDWNLSSPVLSLWSHPDFTTKHRYIAQQHMHPNGATNKNASSEDSPSKESRDPDESFADKVVDITPVKQKHEVKKKVETEHQSNLPEGNARALKERGNPQKKSKSEIKSSKFHGTKKRGLQSHDVVREHKTARRFSGPQNPYPHVANHPQTEKRSTGHIDSPHSRGYSQITDHQKFDYRNFTAYTTPPYDEAEDVVSRYHNILNNQREDPYYSAGVSNNSVWIKHPERANIMDANLHSYRNVHGTEQGHIQPGYTSSYAGQAEPASLQPYQHQYANRMDNVDHSRVTNAGSSGQYSQDAVGFHYNWGAPSASETGSLRYAPSGYKPFLP